MRGGLSTAPPLRWRAADEDARSLSSYIEKLLIDHLRARGFLPKAKK